MKANGIIGEVLPAIKLVGAANVMEKEQLQGDLDSMIAPFFNLSRPKRMTGVVVKWKAPAIGVLMLNTDASVSSSRVAGRGSGSSASW